MNTPSSFQYRCSPYKEVDEYSDILVRVLSVNANNIFNSGFELLLVKQ